MNYYDIANKISRLVEETHVWSSTILLPDGDRCIDISSAAMGTASVTPASATKQPDVYPKGRLHQCIALIRTFMVKILGCNYSQHLLKLVVLVDADWCCITRIRDKLFIGKHVTNFGAVTVIGHGLMAGNVAR
jgi:hypothetical protein